jgi:hypothetical protein
MPHSGEMELVSITVNGSDLAAVGVQEIQSIEMAVVEQLVIINNGDTARPQPVVFSVASSLWVVNHNLGYVPQVMVTDLAGNAFGVEKKVTATQIIVNPIAPTTGYVHYY